MNATTLETALRLTGLMMTGLVAANFVAARRWRYRENLVNCEVMVRQVFHVHCGYIIMIIGALAVLCLGWPGLLLADGMGRVLSGFFGIFWASRVVVQLAYYDPETRSRDRGWDLFFLGVFVVMSTVFTLAAIFG
ncbi:hypothetical protein OKA05_06560 [Luteolibacter arcticus]|uniref:MAPEG family protein n=1 Tax=Luteolibacter arcticus TaxID=1581411 RepID=A0ABT3GF34_9BACT|nr:hypothetical protein [Luteolibacter arcticus]MCW1922207.1 hypothetical protein [Luteolibacter arcticus]